MSDPLPVATVQRRIVPRDGADADELERAILTDVFPAVQTGTDAEPDENVLLRGGPDDGYVWLSRISYDIHQTPLPVWLGNRVTGQTTALGERLAALAEVGEPEVRYDVATWRRRLGV
jgi:hypothetical protein